MKDTMKAPPPGERILEVLGSYGLAVILLGFLFVLTFLGTIEQTEHGLFEVQKKYFESIVLVHWIGRIPLPLPGVYSVLIVLTLNLLVGGLLRIRKSSSTLGVIVIHLGILLMFAAGFVKLKFANDGGVQLYEHETVDEYQSAFEWEIAIWDAAQHLQVKEYLIPGDEFTDLAGDRKRTFESKELPFKLELTHFERNTLVLPKGPMWSSPFPVIDGFAVKVLEPHKEAEANIAGIFMTANGGAPQILWGAGAYPVVVDAGPTKWAVVLRKKRFKLPYAITLDKFTHELYPNTQIAKVFLSDVTIADKDGTHGAKIEMNSPLRERGLVVFQASWGPEGAPPGTPLYSGFAVVENPSDSWPLYSCIVIAIGMLIAFGQKLSKYIKAQAAERQSLEAKKAGGAA